MHRSAVTLMELLVTVTIIAVLISFLIPVIQMVRDSAQRVNCASRVRQAGAAYLAYSIQENGLIPSARLVNPAGGTWTWNNPNSSTMWYELIGPFLDQSANRATSELVTANVLRCPTYQRDSNPWNWSGGGGSRDPQYDNKVFGYAVNTRLLRSRANDMGTGAALPENYLPWYTTNDHWSTEVPSDLRRDTRLARISAASTRALLADSNFVRMAVEPGAGLGWDCLLYTSPSPRDH
jgi:competence protein ComGC